MIYVLNSALLIMRVMRDFWSHKSKEIPTISLNQKCILNIIILA